MAANILKPLKAFRVGEPLPVPIIEIECGPSRLERLSEEVGKRFLAEVINPPKRLHAPKSYPKFRTWRIYRHTHDHVARTTTLIRLKPDGSDDYRFHGVAGILTLRQVLEVHKASNWNYVPDSPK